MDRCRNRLCFFMASASTATKIALDSSQRLIMAQVRFAVAGIIMLFFAHILSKQNLPKGVERKQIIIYVC